jgi:hypothetical protein
MKKVVVVLGMHRSGTSLLAQLLYKCGLFLGTDLRNENAPDNPNGYWEHSLVVSIQEDLTQDLNCDWYGSYADKPLPSNWLNFACTKIAKRKLLSAVNYELSHESCWGFKDPRTMRFLPLWNEIFNELKVQPIYILGVRSPENSIASLVKRDLISEFLAEKIWFINNATALATLNHSLACIIDYDTWFYDAAHNIAKLQKALPFLNYNKSHFETTLDNNLRHSSNLLVENSTRLLYEILRSVN